MAISREVKVGLLVVITGTVLYFGFNFLKGIDFFSTTNRYYVVYESVNGLQPSNPVILNGKSMGQVMNIYAIPEDNYKMVVEFEIDERIKLGDSTVVILTSSLLGDVGLDLQLGFKKGTGGVNYFEPGDTLYSAMEPDMTAILEEKLEPVINNVENMTAKIDSLFDKETKGSLQKTIKNIEITSENFKNLSGSAGYHLATLSKEYTLLAKNINSTITKIKPLVTSLTGVADSVKSLELKQTIANLNVLLDNLASVTSKLDTTNGTLGKMINDPSLYNEMKASLDTLNMLMNQYNDKGGIVPVSIFGDPYKKKEKWERRRKKREAKQK